MIVPRPTDQELLALDSPPPAVLAKLEHFFPRVLSWYEQVEVELSPTGRPLSQREAEFASRVGVKDPTRVRIVVLEDFPLPADAELRNEAERIGMGSKTEGGRTNGYVIMLKPWAADKDAVVSHELVHIGQQDRLGRASFLRRYLIEMEMMGYARSPLELDAYARQSRSL
jgi:hypothetical protein